MALRNLLDWIQTTRLRIVPKTSLPSTGLEGGRIEVKNGVLYIYDDIRSKWLSVNRQTLVFGRNGVAGNQYLSYMGGGMSSDSGYRPSNSATIVSMSVQTSTSDDYSIDIRKNDTLTGIASLSVSGSDNAGEITTDVNLTIGDFLQCYLNYTGSGSGVEDPVVVIELAWRV